MPELPEVQTIVNDLNKKMIGATIIGFWTDWDKAIKIRKEKFWISIKDQRITSVDRIAKNIVIALSNGKYIIIHLRMTGQLLIDNEPADKAPYFFKAGRKHLHHAWTLKKGNKKYLLEFQDIRKFATIDLADSSSGLKNIGLEPLGKNFTLKIFQDILKRKAASNIKTILLDQRSVLGIGNIYASEILFDAKIDPRNKANELSSSQVKKLHASIKKILKKAIRYRGTTFSDYRDTEGKKGNFQNELKVYNRKGQECRSPQCRSEIERIIIGQRSTFYCPECQK